MVGTDALFVELLDDAVDLILVRLVIGVDKRVGVAIQRLARSRHRSADTARPRVRQRPRHRILGDRVALGVVRGHIGLEAVNVLLVLEPRSVVEVCAVSDDPGRPHDVPVSSNLPRVALRDFFFSQRSLSSMS